MPVTKPIDLSGSQSLAQTKDYLEDPDHENHVGYKVEPLRPVLGQSPSQYLAQISWAVDVLNRERSFFGLRDRERSVRWWFVRFPDNTWLKPWEKFFFENAVGRRLSHDGNYASSWHDDFLMGASDLNQFQPFVEKGSPPRRHEWADVPEITYARAQSDFYARILCDMRSANGAAPFSDIVAIKTERRAQRDPNSIEAILATMAHATKRSVTSNTVLGLVKAAKVEGWTLTLDCWLMCAPRKKGGRRKRLWLWDVLEGANRDIIRLCLNRITASELETASNAIARLATSRGETNDHIFLAPLFLARAISGVSRDSSLRPHLDEFLINFGTYCLSISQPADPATSKEPAATPSIDWEAVRRLLSWPDKDIKKRLDELERARKRWIERELANGIDRDPLTGRSSNRQISATGLRAASFAVARLATASATAGDQLFIAPEFIDRAIECAAETFGLQPFLEEYLGQLGAYYLAKGKSAQLTVTEVAGKAILEARNAMRVLHGANPMEQSALASHLEALPAEFIHIPNENPKTLY